MRTPHFSWIACLISALGVLAVSAAPASARRSVTIANDGLGDVIVLAPDGQPDRFAVAISDGDGLTPKFVALAESIADRGAAVALIDLATVRARFTQTKSDECLYPFGDVENLARNAQRKLGTASWRWPLLLGVGEGGTLAYLILAQAPDNTSGGAISLGFEPRFKSIRPLCPGAPTAAQAGEMVTYKPMDDVPGRWTLIVPEQPTEAVTTFLDAAEGSKIETIAGADGLRFEAAIKGLFELPPQRPSSLSDLPLIELPAAGQTDALLILISGDGGWRDIDRQIGEYIAGAGGVSVVGIDSFSYFWDRKDPKQIAADLDRIADFYVDKWKVKSVGLGGYSFGADVIPLAWPLLSRDGQARTKLIVLLGLEPTADLQVSVTGLLGIADANDIPLSPHLSALPKEKVLCFYGADEAGDNDTACTAKELDGATRVMRPGGHHFDGNYAAVAQAIVDRLR